jgi:hypothetical protein
MKMDLATIESAKEPDGEVLNAMQCGEATALPGIRPCIIV